MLATKCAPSLICSLRNIHNNRTCDTKRASSSSLAPTVACVAPLSRYRLTPSPATASRTPSPPGASSRDPAPRVDADVVVIGAGLAGLACARSLHRTHPDLTIRVLEATDDVGGRARTDVHPDGFLLDRGFAIILSSYETQKAEVDLDRLELRPFYSGAKVRFRGDWHVVSDPFRHPVDALRTLLPTHPIGSVLDKVKVGVLRFKAVFMTPDTIISAPETTIGEALVGEGFSPEMINRFFRPFLGGIFFDRGLGTTSRLLFFVMRALATGQNCLPRDGIGAIAQQLAQDMNIQKQPPSLSSPSPSDERDDTSSSSSSSTSTSFTSSSKKITVHLDTPVMDLRPGVVTTASGELISTHAVVVATDGPAAEKLLASALGDQDGTYQIMSMMQDRCRSPPHYDILVSPPLLTSHIPHPSSSSTPLIQTRRGDPNPRCQRAWVPPASTSAAGPRPRSRSPCSTSMAS